MNSVKSRLARMSDAMIPTGLSIAIAIAVVSIAMTSIALPPSPAPAARRDDPQFNISCPPSHQSQDDPIVFPGQPGAAHLHMFFGNRSTTALSTPASLSRLGSPTTCKVSEDTAAYWIPVLYKNGVPVEPIDFNFYYAGRTRPLTNIRAFPPGLKMIAGNHHATAPQPIHVINWVCDSGGSSVGVVPPADCGANDVAVRVKYPDCWNGIDLDSVDHKSHMAYSVQKLVNGTRVYVCPSSHPVPVPRLYFKIVWPIHRGAGISFSSGPHYTLHGDFINSWQQDKLEELIRLCIHADRKCGSIRRSGLPA